MNMPINEEHKVNFTTTLFALIRENLSIKMRPAEEMDQADKELRDTIKKLWPLQAKKVVDKLLPRDDGERTLECSSETNDVNSINFNRVGPKQDDCG